MTPEIRVNPNAPVSARMLGGVRDSLRFFAPYTVVILAILLIAGRHIESFGGSAIDLLLLLVTYPLGAVFLGAILALLAPLMRNALAGAMVGVIAALPITIGVAITIDNGLVAWDAGHSFAVAISAVFLGARVGIKTFHSTGSRDGAA